MDEVGSTEQISEATTSETEARRTLTRQEFFATFQFAQGSYDLHLAITRYLKLLHPNLSMAEDEFDAILRQSLRPAATIVSDPRRHSTQSAYFVKINLQEMLDESFEILNESIDVSRNRLVEKQLIGEIAMLACEQDWEYLKRGGGRDYETSDNQKFNPYKDSWRSDICYFGFLGNTTVAGHV